MLKRILAVSFICIILLLSPLSPHLQASLANNSELAYSFVHISDTQTLSNEHPEILNETFSYLESIKSEYNIKKIVITGDLVHHADNTVEWERFNQALTLTSIPIDCLAGNHDIGNNGRYYEEYIGADKWDYYSVVEDFLFLYISWCPSGNTLSKERIDYFKSIIEEHPDKKLVICTHYYMDGEGQLSPLGEQTVSNLVRPPFTSILCGHLAYGENVKNIRTLGNTTIYEFITNYQGGNHSYARLFKVNVDGSISESLLRVVPGPAKQVTNFLPLEDPQPAAWTQCVYSATILLGQDDTILPGQYALAFEETRGYLKVPDSASLNVTDGLTLEAWLRIDSHTQDINSNPLRKGWSYGFTNRCGLNAIDFWVRVEGAPRFSGCHYIWSKPNGWHHIAGTYSVDNKTVSLYVDGDLVKEQAIPSLKNYHIEPWVDGFRVGGGQGRACTIDEVRIYDRALTTDEISYSYNNLIPMNTDGLVCWLKMNEGDGKLVHDETENNNDGTIYEASWRSGGCLSSLPETSDGDTVSPWSSILITLLIGLATVAAVVFIVWKIRSKKS